MNNKGFTLIELLATVVLLSLVMGIGAYGVSNTIAKSVWDEYKKIGNLDETILLSIVKGSQAGNKISVRYLNDTSLDEEDVLEEFIFNLMESGYREKLNTSRKKRYVNSEYQVVIFCDFDYITIVMEKM